MANQPHAFKHREVVRCLKAASAAGIEHPSVRIRLPGGTEYVVSGAAVSPPSKSGRTEPPKSQR